MLGAGFVGLVLATFWAFPELRRGWWAVAVLVNPALVEALLLGQLPFLWAAAMLMLAIGCWRRDRRKTAVVLAALAQLTHARRARSADRAARRDPLPRRARPARAGRRLADLARDLAAGRGCSCSRRRWPRRTRSLYTALDRDRDGRAAVARVPRPDGAGVAAARRMAARAAPMVLAGVMVRRSAGDDPVLRHGRRLGCARSPTRADGVSALPQSPTFVPGATYRVLTFGDAKYGQYSVVRAGGRLDSEFFPESMYRRSFPDEAAYARFLDRAAGRLRGGRSPVQQVQDQRAAAARRHGRGGSTVRRRRRGAAGRHEPRLTRLYRVTRSCPG